MFNIVFYIEYSYSSDNTITLWCNILKGNPPSFLFHTVYPNSFNGVLSMDNIRKYCSCTCYQYKKEIQTTSQYNYDNQSCRIQVFSKDHFSLQGTYSDFFYSKKVNCQTRKNTKVRKMTVNQELSLYVCKFIFCQSITKAI